MINTLSFNGPMREQFVKMNGIKSAFFYKENDREWSVYEGNSETLCGFLAGTFTTRRDAKALSDKINEAIK